MTQTTELGILYKKAIPIDTTENPLPMGKDFLYAVLYDNSIKICLKIE